MAVAAASGATRVLAKGEVLYDQGDSADDPPLYAVVEGLLLVERASPRGTRHLLAVLGPGDLAGEVGALDPRPRSARITALVPATVAVVPRERLLVWLATHPDSMAAVLSGLSRRVHLAEDKITDITELTTGGRLAGLLVELAERFGTQDGPDVTVEHGLTQEQLAGLVASTRESVNKALKAFAAEGLLTHRRGRLLVTDLEGLRRAALASYGSEGGGPSVRRRRPLARSAARR